MNIKSFEFTNAGILQADKETKCHNWPVVYLINGNNKIYIGETSNFIERFKQHLANKHKRVLKNIYVILDDEFNKSATLDIEQTLIRMCGSDQKFTLLNGNAGQSPRHNYYQREKYLNKIEGDGSETGIWNSLREIGLADKTYEVIINSDLFKFSPYTALTSEQEEVCFNVINDILDGLKNNAEKSTTCVIKGNAGTGKTLLAVYMMHLIVNANKQLIDAYREDETTEVGNYKIKVIHKLTEYIKKNGKLDIGYVLPMTSIRSTLKTVFRQTGDGLKSKMVVGPTEIVGKSYDILLVDEAHRLPKRKNISWMGEFDRCCQKLGLQKEEANTLDWIVKCSRSRILFYDPNQTIKASDITEKEFRKSLGQTSIKEYELLSQLRCEGGELYTNYLDAIFNCSADTRITVNNYDVKVFDDPNQMIDSIKRLNNKYGLCRNVAGYSWKWKTKGLNSTEIEETGVFDIELDGKRYIWNMTNMEWILRKESINEIGCIHTTQGYDLNYVGVILGKEIDFDPLTESMIINPQEFYDVNVKKGCSPERLKTYIVNTYKVMLERGIKGCYIYACNDNMRNYLKRFF